MNDAKWAITCFVMLCVVFFVLVSSICRAQTDLCDTGPGEMQGSLLITPGIGCVPLQVKAYSGIAGVQNVRYVYDYKGGAVNASEFARDSVFEYTKPGLYRILQYSEQNGRQLRACAIVQVYDTLQPELVVTGCQTRVMIAIPKAADYNYDWYTVDWGDGTHEQISGPTPLGVHTYSDDSQRIITVQGTHLYGHCGGTTRTVFRPNTKIEMPFIDQMRPISTDALELVIANPSGNRFWLEKRLEGEDFERMTTHADFVLRTQINTDTSVPVCFRFTLADTCLQAPPSPEVCYTPPKPDPEPDSTVFMPDAFSPNADGINDQFLPQGFLEGVVRLTVYNRWGEVVFRTEDARDGWDGKKHGQPLPPGAYMYRLDIEKTDGKRFHKQGTVVLLK